MKVLVIAAHPDDELLGLGGTLARHVHQGDEVFVLILTDGQSSRTAIPDKEVIALRKKAALEASLVLGVKELYIENLPDQGLDTVPLVDIVKTIEGYMRKIRPDTVYLHHSGDLNKDHQIAFEAGITASRPTGDFYPNTILSYETFSSTEWAPPSPDKSFLPNYFVDIGNYFQLKMDAITKYRAEIREFPHPRSPEAIKAAAIRWGSLINVNFAEAFMLIRKIEK